MDEVEADAVAPSWALDDGGRSRRPCELTTKAALDRAVLPLFSSVAQRRGGVSWPKRGPTSAWLLVSAQTVESVPESAAAAAAAAADVQCSMILVFTARVQLSPRAGTTAVRAPVSYLVATVAPYDLSYTSPPNPAVVSGCTIVW